MESNYTCTSTQRSASGSNDVFSVQFETAIWKDLGDDISNYTSELISDSELSKLTKSPVIPLSPRKDFTNVTTAYYRKFRLREYTFLRENFPDIKYFRVERSKSDKYRRVNRERFLVQVGSVGYYLKKSTLETCEFFRIFFLDNFDESQIDRCLLEPYESLFPEQVCTAIMEYLCGSTVDFELHSWKDILVASDYYGCYDIHEAVDDHLVEENVITKWEEAVLLLYEVKVTCGWFLPKTAKMCLELIKSNLHFLIHKEESVQLIGHISLSTMTSILQDSRLTYISMRERRVLMRKWIGHGMTQVEKCQREELLQYVNSYDNTSPSVSLGLQRLDNGLSQERQITSNHICLSNPRPTIIVAGGTGEGIKYSGDDRYCRPLTASKSMMAYKVNSNCWSHLPDLPVSMFRPMVVTNDLDTIYVIDAYAFREQDAIKQHCLFSLFYDLHGWHWKSFTFEFPVGIRSFQLLNLFHVNGELYMLGTSKVHENNWSMGSPHREQPIGSLQEQQLSPSGSRVVVLLSFNRANSTVDVVKFLFHANLDADVNSCVMDNKICVGTRSGYFLGERPESYPVFGIHNSKLDGVFYQRDVSHRDIHDDDSVPANSLSGRADVLSVSEEGGLSGTFHFGPFCFVDTDDNVIPFPPSRLHEDEDSVGKSPMVVAHHNTVYCLGGWNKTTKKSLNRCLSITIARGNKRRIWCRFAQLPRRVTNGGSVFSNFITQPLSHHIDCPHCKLYPEDVLQADMSGVQLPPNYEANLVTAYPPTEYY